LDETDGSAPAPESDVAVEPINFDAAKQVVEVARLILAGDPSEEELADLAAQATREPFSDTVQKPAGE
jgi:hypothetical protein